MNSFSYHLLDKRFKQYHQILIRDNNNKYQLQFQGPLKVINNNNNKANFQGLISVQFINQ